MYNLIISIPLITAIIILTFGRKIGILGVKFLSLLNMSKILIISIIYLIQEITKILPISQFLITIPPRPSVEELRVEWGNKEKSILRSENNSIRWPIELKKIKLKEWINIGQIEEGYNIEINRITIIMTTLIIIISFSVIFYSFWYLQSDTHLNRFISYLLLFTTSMLILVNSSNILLLFLGWESVGITSYILINYWYNNINSNKSAIKAILYNKIGDISLLIFILILLLISPNTNFSTTLILNNYLIFN